MELKLSTNNLENYLEASSIIDYDNLHIKELGDKLKEEATNEIDLIQRTFEYVRDSIHHSADIQGENVTYRASDVLKYKEGTCYSKSYLLAALLRCNKIPTGFCYQKLNISNETEPYIILHGLNGVYVSSVRKWIRLDPRGNINGIDAQFNLDKEQLAYPIRTEKGDEDILVVFGKPDDQVMAKLMKYKKVEDLFKDLPSRLKDDF